jgi:hypothetical protein
VYSTVSLAPWPIALDLPRRSPLEEVFVFFFGCRGNGKLNRWGQQST